MDKKIEQAVEDAASNVSCEVGDVPKDTLVQIKEHLLGMTGKTDDSFIYSLYQSMKEEKEKERAKTYGVRK